MREWRVRGSGRGEAQGALEQGVEEPVAVHVCPTLNPNPPPSQAYFHERSCQHISIRD